MNRQEMGTKRRRGVVSLGAMRMWIVILSLVCSSGCKTRSFSHWTKNSQWVLVKVELDRRHLGNRGKLPIFAPQSDESFGRAPMAMGSLAVSEDGRVVCRIMFQEESPDGSYRYPVLTFDGLFGDDPGRIELVRPPGPNVPLGVATVLHVRELRNGRLEVQGATGEKLLPYVFVFARPPARMGLVPIPAVDPALVPAR